MPVLESAFATKVAATLTAGIIQQAGARFARKLKKTEVQKALGRCGEAALEALIEHGFPDGTDIPREHLQDVLRQFAADDVVHDVLAGAIRDSELRSGDIAELRESFEEAHPLKTLPGFDSERAIAGFVTAFVDQADEEEGFQGLIQTKELKKQTRVQRELRDESLKQTDLQGEILDHLRDTKNEGGTNALRHAYLNDTFHRLRELALSGLDPALANDPKTQMDLDAVYTALLTRSEAAADKDTDPEALVRQHEGRRPLSALELLDRHDRLVLLGDPGSGKSTFVSFVALCMAGELLERDDANLTLLTLPLPDDNGDPQEEEPQPWSHGSLLPVPVILRHFAARGLPEKGTPAGARHLLAFLRDELERSGLGAFFDALEAEIRNRGGILFLDGLDEVPEAEHRRVQLRDVVRSFAGAFPRCRILVTSRIYAYQNQEWWLGKSFHEATLAQFTPGQIRRFVSRWYDEIARRRNLTPEDARGRAVVLEQAIFANDRLLALAERPLLLTLMASLHAWRGGTLPDKRESLYHAAVELLLAQWERHRVVDGMMQPSLAEWLKVSQDRLHSALDELAFQAHAIQKTTDGTADIQEGDLLAALARVSATAEANPARLVEYLRDRAGLLLPRGLGVYTFPHRTFQEYLAARHLTADEFPQKVAMLARKDPERWRETVLLAGAKAVRGIPSSVWQLARELSSLDPANVDAGPGEHWGALLAGQVIIESADLERLSEAQARQRDEIRHHLLSGMRGTTLPPVERAVAGWTLAALGDPRPEVTTLEAMQFCHVRGGFFRMGSEKYEPERPAYDPHIPYDYWIARYPVTVAQFRQYVEQSGQQPGDPDSLRGSPNEPVVWVNWYEAKVLCEWLTCEWHERGLLPKGWAVRLPSEAEWEKAARGGAEIPRTPQLAKPGEAFLITPVVAGELRRNSIPARDFPWGSAFDEHSANTVEAGIGAPSAVGAFARGSSPYGCEDMGGNVLEWTRSHSGNDSSEPVPRVRFNPTDGHEKRKAADEGEMCVVRGGSFGVKAHYARCSARQWVNATGRAPFTGLRISVSPADP